jgi:hypothetical protein
VRRSRANKDRQTPQTDRWVAALRERLDAEYGAQAALARHLCAPDEPTPVLMGRWTGEFSRWFRREGFPNLEEYFRVEEWLATNRLRRKKVKPNETDGAGSFSN